MRRSTLLPALPPSLSSGFIDQKIVEVLPPLVARDPSRSHLKDFDIWAGLFSLSTRSCVAHREQFFRL
jgi:hypothetical protein